VWQQYGVLGAGIRVGDTLTGGGAAAADVGAKVGAGSSHQWSMRVAGKRLRRGFGKGLDRGGDGLS
jgi:hypothetical protein